MVASATSRAIDKTPDVSESTRPSLVRPLSADWLVGALIGGCMLGWSAPGMDLAWIAWIGLAPLFVACSMQAGARQAAVLGTVFGAAFNLVYLQWYLQVRASAWTAIFSLAPSVSAVGVWLAMSLWQGLFIGVVCYLLHRMPLCAGFLPERWEQGKWRLPLYVVAPVVWVVVVEKICNFPGFLGVPWSMLQYTQYKQPIVLQVAALVGGSGLACLIVLCNLVIASAIATAVGGSRIAFSSRRAAMLNIAAAVALLLGVLLFGDLRLTETRALSAPTVSVAALQSNLIAPVHAVATTKSIQRGLELAIKTPADVCVWPEWTVPIDWTRQKDFVQFFAHEALMNKQVWVLGTFDSGGTGGRGTYNSVGVVRADGTAIEQAYHKQYLVPFGEYVPDWLYYSPLLSLFDPWHQAQHGMIAGSGCSVLDSGKAKLGPLICFENCLPLLAASSVRSGAQLLVDCSNTTWFNYSNVLGKQLIAFSVLRAVENHRSFVFSTVLGPSAIIDPNGRILQQANIDQSIALESKVPLESDLTPFARFCAF